MYENHWKPFFSNGISTTFTSTGEFFTRISAIFVRIILLIHSLQVQGSRERRSHLGTAIHATAGEWLDLPCVIFPILNEEPKNLRILKITPAPFNGVPIKPYKMLTWHSLGTISLMMIMSLMMSFWWLGWWLHFCFITLVGFIDA